MQIGRDCLRDELGPRETLNCFREWINTGRWSEVRKTLRFWGANIIR